MINNDSSHSVANFGSTPFIELKPMTLNYGKFKCKVSVPTELLLTSVAVEMQKIVKEYQEGDASTKAHLEKRYGRTQIQRFVNDMLSDNWIQTNSKNCPKCEASIEVSDSSDLNIYIFFVRVM